MSFINEIKKNPNLRRLFGKRELLIMRKQLWGMPLSPSERTRLSRDIRKKLAVINALSRFKEEFALKKAAAVNAMIQKAKELILNHPLAPHIKKIIFFGSVAEEEHRFGSDIDIAVLFSSIDAKEAAKFRMNVLGDLPSIIDIQVYNILPDKIKYQIEKHGKTIYQRKD